MKTGEFVDISMSFSSILLHILVTELVIYSWYIVSFGILADLSRLLDVTKLMKAPLAFPNLHLISLSSSPSDVTVLAR